MRTNHAGVQEVAHIRTNLENFGEGHERVFGEPEKQFCDTCELRFSLCVCTPKGGELEGSFP